MDSWSGLGIGSPDYATGGYMLSFSTCTSAATSLEWLLVNSIVA